MEEFEVTIGRRTLVRTHSGVIANCGGRFTKSDVRERVESRLYRDAKWRRDQEAAVYRMIRNGELPVEEGLGHLRRAGQCPCDEKQQMNCGSCQQYHLAEQLIAEGKL